MVKVSPSVSPPPRRPKTATPQSEQGALRPEWLREEPWDDYQKKRTSNVSASSLKHYIRDPLVFRKMEVGDMRIATTREFLIGTAFHALALEGREAFERIVAPPTEPKPKGRNGKTLVDTSCKSWQEAERTAGKIILSVLEEVMIESMYASMLRHGPASHLIQSGGFAEGVIRTKMFDVPIQGRLDWFSPSLRDHGVLVDLKTTKNVDDFERQANELQYDVQAGVYQMLAEQQDGVRRPFVFIAVEKEEPFRTAVFETSQVWVERGRSKAEAALRGIAQSRKSGKWTSPYDSVQRLDIAA